MQSEIACRNWGAKSAKIFKLGRSPSWVCSLVHQVQQRGPLSVHTVVLLRKSGRQSTPFQPDYCGFVIPDVFVVGYGLDYRDEYRHIPYLAGLDPEDLL